MYDATAFFPIYQKQCVLYFELFLFGLLSKLLTSLLRNNFPKRPSGAPHHTLSKTCWFCNPLPSFEAVYFYIFGNRRVAIARYQMICLVLVKSHLFPLSCRAVSMVPREGFNSSVILASLLVFPILGCRHSLLRLGNNSRLSLVE